MFTTIVIFLPMYVSAILAAFLAVELVDRYQWVKSLLLAFLIACTFLYAGHAIYFSYYTNLIPVSDTIYSFCNLAVYPLYFIYVVNLTEKRPHHYYYWLSLLPAVICSLAMGCCYVLMDSAECSRFIEDYLYNNDSSELSGTALYAVWVHVVSKILFGVQIIPILVFGMKKINRYNKNVRSYYADTDTRLLVHIKVLYIIFFVTSTVSFVSNIIGRHSFLDSPDMVAIPSVLFSMLIFTLAYVGIKRDFTADDMEQEMAADPELPVEPVVRKAANSSKDLCRRIEQVMKDEKMFLRNDLKISDLSLRLGSNRNYIYNAINVEMGVSFSDYINRQRIDYAVAMMREHPDMPVNEVYLKTGFSSSSSFYRNFRLYMGCTPKEYVEKAKF
ncbi:MAG: helix-turn-helix transcriptional regulator [Prevotella sp.]|nr:helix-turn-helix transcriptional regulator [Prevotella sp.]